MAELMRDKTAVCTRCHGKRFMTFNLTKGKVEKADMPGKCLTPQACLDDLKKNIMDRPFDAPPPDPRRF